MRTRIGWIAIAVVMASFCCCGGLVFADIAPAESIGGAPEEIAKVVAFLASNSGGYITGETIHVNGGMYMP